MTSVHLLHDYLLSILLPLSILVTTLLMRVYTSSALHSFPSHLERIETAWTLIPALLLITIAIPSLTLLYTESDTLTSSSNSLLFKVTGYQWYWHYDLADHSSLLSYDSFMEPSTLITPMSLRKLEVDLEVSLPYSSLIHYLISSKDVIHNWALPHFSLKIDALPGRVNSQTLSLNSIGKFYGQCSELCGANHRFMPINLVVHY